MSGRGSAWLERLVRDTARNGVLLSRPNIVGDPNTGTCPGGVPVRTASYWFNANALIVKYHKRSSVPLRPRICYGTRMRQVALFFNSGIENVVFQPAIRNRIGIRHSGTAYISPAWTMNLLYARVKPKGILSTFLFVSVLGFFRLSEWIFFRFCRWFS